MKSECRRPKAERSPKSEIRIQGLGSSAVSRIKAPNRRAACSPLQRAKLSPYRELDSNSEVASGDAGGRCCSAGILACGFTGLSSPVFPFRNWRLESRQNPQAGKPAPPPHHDPTPEFGLKRRTRRAPSHRSVEHTWFRASGFGFISAFGIRHSDFSR
jgi:hypothetical protein